MRAHSHSSMTFYFRDHTFVDAMVSAAICNDSHAKRDMAQRRVRQWALHQYNFPRFTDDI